MDRGVSKRGLSTSTACFYFQRLHHSGTFSFKSGSRSNFPRAYICRCFYAVDGWDLLRILLARRPTWAGNGWEPGCPAYCTVSPGCNIESWISMEHLLFLLLLLSLLYSTGDEKVLMYKNINSSKVNQIWIKHNTDLTLPSKLTS